MALRMTPDNIAHQSEESSLSTTVLIPFLGGRPQRDTIIGADDIINLRIACNTKISLEEFLQLL